MADGSRPNAPSELEAVLMAVGSRIDFPAPDVAGAVSARLRAGERPAAPVVDIRRLGVWYPGVHRPSVCGAARPLFRPRWQNVAAVAASLAVILAGTLVVSPGARDAVADLLGLRGVRIKVVPSLSPLPSSSPSLGAALMLGEQVTLATAQSRVGYRIRIPGKSGFQVPDEVYLNPQVSGGQVTLLYRARPGLPAASFTGAGLLLTEFPGRTDRQSMEKAIGGGTNLLRVEVHGQPGFWISGAPHELFYLDENGNHIPQEVRLAGNVLLWQDGDVTLRMEWLLGKRASLALAGSIR
jgi:hypothetical protein